MEEINWIVVARILRILLIYIYIYGREQGAINVMKVSTINSRGKVKIFKKKGALKFHNDNNPFLLSTRK